MLTFAPYCAIALPTVTPPDAISALPAAFTRDEWGALHIGAGDRLATLRRPGRYTLLLHRLFGVRSANRLADPRIETLRRTAVLLHWCKALPPSDKAAFHDAGFSEDQLAIVKALVQAA